LSFNAIGGDYTRVRLADCRRANPHLELDYDEYDDES
jgi:hypothetical protein